METMNVHHPLLCYRDDLCLCDVDLSTDISTLRYLLEHVVRSRTGNLPILTVGSVILCGSSFTMRTIV